MEYIRFTEISAQEWDNYLEQFSNSTFNYKANKINFDVEYAKNIIENEAFLMLDNKKPIAAAAIYIEKIEGQGNQMRWSNSYCPAPYIETGLSYRLQEKYSKKVFEYLEQIAKKYQCEIIKLRLDPLCNPEQTNKFYNCNYLWKHGFIDYSSLTQIIDLRASEEEIYADIRKGHKSNIKSGKQYEIEFYDAHNMQDEKIHLYREIYEKDAGMVTRNSEMTHHYLQFIKDGNAVLGFAKKDGVYLAVIIVTCYKNTAYYSSYAELTEQMNHVPAGHILQWESMKYLKNHGIEFYEIGEQVYGKTHYSNPEEKLIHISNYKRGFGGYTVPFFRGEKKLQQ